VGLFKTIDVILGSPNRSKGWKVFEVTILCALWFATIVSIIIWLDGNAWTTWSLIARLLLLVTGLATARSVNDGPKLRVYRRPKTAR
jgi:hypothetical protein